MGLGLRFVRLDAQELWFDETGAVWLASQPLDELLAAMAVEANPPIYFLLLKAWMWLGQSEWWLRLPQVLLGGAGVLLAHRLGRAWLDSERAAAWAAWLTALSPLMLRYGQEVRAYILWLDLTALALLLARRWLDGAGRRAAWGYAAAAALSFNVHYGAGFFLPFLAAWLFWETRRDQSARRHLILIHLAILAACLPGLRWYWLNARQVAGDFWVPGLDLALLVRETNYLVAGWAGWADWRWLTLPLLAGLLGLGLAGRSTRPLAVLALAPMLLVAVVSLAGRPLFLARILLPSALLVIMVAAGLAASGDATPSARWGRRLGGAMLAAGAAGVVLYFAFPGGGAKPDEKWRELAAHLQAQGRPGDLVVYAPAWTEFGHDWYRRRLGAPALARWGLPRPVEPRRGPYHGQPADLAGAVERMWREMPAAPRHWLVTAFLDDPGDLVGKSFAARGRLLDTRDFKPARLRLYETGK